MESERHFHRVVFQNLERILGKSKLELVSVFINLVRGSRLIDFQTQSGSPLKGIDNVPNVRFVRTDIAELFKGRDITGNFKMMNLPKPDVIVLDPPRSGLHPKIAANVHLLQAEKIVYVSCNPMTQARDVKEIVANGYTPVSSQPVDMFPQTYHIENVLTLVRS